VTGLCWAWLSTPVGQVSVGCSPAGVSRVRYGAPPVDNRAGLPSERRGHDADADPAARELAHTASRELTEYFRGDRRSFDVAVDWAAASGPQREVLRVLSGSVGYGQTVSYGELARRAGLAADGPVPPARTVGKIMGSNPIPLIVPCHRVLASDGLGGYSGGAGVEVKRWLLILEGALPPTLDWQPMDQQA
jgi:methylated-DNA-[protein]-cysteine S-methyltransferase